MLIEVPKGDASRHEPACRECGEPWPCRTRREEYRFREHLQNVRCEFCGEVRVSWGSLTIDEGLDGRAIYFHAKFAYIAGPVTGLPDRNRAAFEAARRVVERVTGAHVTIPHDFVKESDAETTAMVLCVVAICDTIKLGVPLFVVLLPGWRESLGTAVEVALARKLGVPVVELVDGALREADLVIQWASEADHRRNGETASDLGTSE